MCRGRDAISSHLARFYRHEQKKTCVDSKNNEWSRHLKREESHQNPHNIFAPFPQTLGYYAAALETTAPLAPHRTAGGHSRTYAVSGSRVVCPANTVSATVSATLVSHDIAARDTQTPPDACNALAAQSLRPHKGLPAAPARQASPQSPRYPQWRLPPTCPASIQLSQTSILCRHSA